VVNAAAIASATLRAPAWLVATPEWSPTLYWWIGRAWMIVGIWLVAGPIWESGRSGDDRDVTDKATSEKGSW
jgi:hypothetical protein